MSEIQSVRAPATDPQGELPCAQITALWRKRWRRFSAQTARRLALGIKERIVRQRRHQEPADAEAASRAAERLRRGSSTERTGRQTHAYQRDRGPSLATPAVAKAENGKIVGAAEMTGCGKLGTPLQRASGEGGHREAPPSRGPLGIANAIPIFPQPRRRRFFPVNRGVFLLPLDTRRLRRLAQTPELVRLAEECWRSSDG